MRKASWVLVFLFGSVGAQNIPVDSWRSHFSYTNGRILELANETLFCATENGLFSINTSTQEFQKFGKETGLGDARVTALHFASSAQILIVGYESGVVDLIHGDGEINTILTVRDAPIVAEKGIKSITSNGNRAYLATGFGVVYLNLATEAVIESYRSIGDTGEQLSIEEVFATEDSLIVVSSRGIQAGSFSDNLLDFNDWVRFSETTSSTFNHLTQFQGKLHVVSDGTEIWQFDGEVWGSTGLETTSSIRSTYAADQLYLLTPDQVLAVGESIQVLQDTGDFAAGNDLVETATGLWIADGESGLLEVEDGFGAQIPRGPQGDYPTRLEWVDGKIFGLYGPSGPAYDGTFDQEGYSQFQNGVWSQKVIPGFSNITDVDAIGSNLYFSSLGNGLYDHENESIINEANSTFDVSDDYGTVDLTSIDTQGNSLWITGYGMDNSVYQFNGQTLTAFGQSNTGTKYPVDIEVSELGVLWIRKSNFEGGGIATYSPSISEQRTFGTSSGLPSSQTTGLVIDGNDRVWISTINGLSTYDGASFPFNSFGITVPIFDNRFLFEDEQINDVMTDGGDRVWVATQQNGVWVLAADLSEVVAQYTTENSPLPSNSVRSFGYDEVTGEVFISTEKGIVSYRSASSKGQPAHAKSIGVFPNPVSAGFNGQVAFTGLVKNATLKITDVKGRLVQEIMASGSTASWDLSSFSGGRAQSGVYLVFSSSEDGQETLVGKIAVLK